MQVRDVCRGPNFRILVANVAKEDIFQASGSIMRLSSVSVDPHCCRITCTL